MSIKKRSYNNQWFKTLFMTLIICSVIFAKSDVNSKNKGLKIIVDINDTGDYTSIQQAINAASDSDTVLVYPGTYLENINYNGKNIVIASLFLTTEDSSYISQTTIDANGNGTVVTFEGGEDSSATLAGITLENGSSINGSGIFCDNSSGPTIKYVRIINNSATNFGGGIYCDNNSDIRLIRVKILENDANLRGGGIFALNSDPFLENVVIGNNATGSYGGGIYCYNSSPVIINSTLANNSAALGGGAIYLKNNSSPVMLNTILWDNIPEQIFCSSISDANTFSIAYCDIENGIEGIETNNNGEIEFDEGNIILEPFFENAIENDFHIQEISDCIGAGTDSIEINNASYFTPVNDIDGSPRPNPADSPPDIGAYEHIREFSRCKAPTGLSIVAGNQKATINWNSNNESTLYKYYIYRDEFSPASTLIDSVIVGSEPDTLYIDSGLLNNYLYYYRITAVDSVGIESEFSDEVSVTPFDNEPPNPPENVWISDSLQVIELNWSANTEIDIDYYNIYRADTNRFNIDPEFLLHSVNHPDSSFSDSLIQNSVKYYYLITAVDTAQNESNPSQLIEVTSIFVDIWDVNFSQQKNGSANVDINYSFSGHDTTHYGIESFLWDDDSSTWWELSHTTGDIGTRVLAGAGKHILWNFGQQYENSYNKEAIIKIIVSTLNNCEKLQINKKEIKLESRRKK